MNNIIFPKTLIGQFIGFLKRNNNRFVYKDFEDYEKSIGQTLPNNYKLIWDMARVKNKDMRRMARE